MILVTLGTQKQDFSRLLQYIEDSKIKDEIIVQAGYTKFKSKKMKIFDFISYEEMSEYIEKADFVITHSGTGSVLSPLKKDKKVIVCARLSKYGEHVDDHQKQLVEIFKEEGYVLELTEDNKLDDLVKDLKKFKPKKYISNTENFIKKLDLEIKKKTNKQSPLIFLLVIGYIVLGIGLLIFRPQKEISYSENRYLNKINISLISKFNTGEFQNNIDNALPDQVILSETFKKIGNVINNTARKISLAMAFDYNKYGVEPYANELDLIKDTDYIVYRPYDFDQMLNSSKKSMNIIKSVATKYPNISVYVYKVNRDIDFMHQKKYDSEIIKLLDGKVGYSSFSKIKNYDDYMKYFYKSDHHWNNVGQYEGYKEIAKLLGIEDIIQIKSVDCLNGIQFRGSKARSVGDTKIMDDFCVNIYDIEDYEVTLSGNVFDIQGTREGYTLRNYPIVSDVSHYAQYYGYDYGELVYKFKDNTNKKNLLMFVDSFSNPINELIAANYYNTYVVDLRHYHELTGEEFNIHEYIKNNSIDEILVLGNANVFMYSEFFIDKEVK